MRNSIERTMIVGFGLVVAITVVLIVGSFLVSARYTEMSGSVSHAQEVRGELARTLDVVMGVESAQRLYVVLGSDVDLAAYRAARQRVAPQVTLLRDLIVDHSGQDHRVVTLRADIDTRLAWLETGVRKRQKHGLAAFHRLPPKRRGQQAMAAVRRDIAEMDALEARLVKSRIHTFQGFTYQTTLVGVGLGVLILCSLCVVFVGVRELSRARQFALETNQNLLDERLQAEEHIRALNAAMEQATEGIAYLDPDGCYLYVNETYALMAGFFAEEMVGSHWSCTVAPEARAVGLAEYQRMKAYGKVACEVRGRRKDGGEFFKEVTLIRDLDEDGRFVGHYAFAKDITARKEAEAALKQSQLELQRGQIELAKANARLEALATTDSLTGIKNHRAFCQLAELELARASRLATPLSLLMVDVDHFKPFNDTFGHPAGDRVLKKLAAVLQSCARATDVVARIGGEEFAVILADTDVRGAIDAAERIRDAVEAEEWENRSITVSIGAASLHATTENISTMVEEADAALYVSKSDGRNRVTHYRAEGLATVA